METNKEFCKERRILSEGNLSSGEYILPDYKGDVKKLLSQTARCESSEGYLNGDKLECTGVVVYDIVYLDSEDILTPLTFTTDYEISVKVDENKYVDNFTRVSPSSFNLRLMGPRKFSAKAGLQLDLSLLERDEYRVEGDAGERESTETMTRIVNISSGKYAIGGEREFAEEVEHLEGAIVDEVEVLYLWCEPRDIAIKENENGLSVTGEINATMLLKLGIDPPYTVNHSISFEGLVECDIDPKEATAYIDILSSKASVNPEESGVSVTLDVIAVPKVKASFNVPLRIIKDMYSTERGVDVTLGEIGYTELVGEGDGIQRFSYDMTREDAALIDARNILYATAMPKIESAAAKDDAVVIDGILRFSGIACEVNEDGGISYSPVKIDAPLALNVNYGSQIPENSKIVAEVIPTSAKIELDSDTVRLSASLDVRTSVYDPRREGCLQSAQLNDEVYAKAPSTVTVYYPDKNDTLYEVAKMHHTTPLKIAKDNELTEDVVSRFDTKNGLSGVDFLLIR